MTELDDSALLRLEMAMLWDADEAGRLHHRAHHLAIGVTDDGCIAATGAHLPRALAEELRLLALTADTARPPTVLARCEALLRERYGPVEVSGGPSFAVPTAGLAIGGGETVSLSDGPAGERLRHAWPDGWQRREWQELLDGDRGPWAVAVERDRVVACCITPVSSRLCAEAGVWTDPAFRGRGHAAAVTARWAEQFSGGPRRLFYSTSLDNSSSQRVAARLRLRRIGWLWKLSRSGEASHHAHRPWIDLG